MQKFEEISLRIIEPSDKRELLRTSSRTCCHRGCPLLAQGMCLNENIILSANCPNSRTHDVKHVTKRSSQYKAVLSGLKLIEKKLLPYKQRFANIGTHVYLNYRYMNLDNGRDSLPFLSNTQIFKFGSQFMAIEDFTLATIIKIVEFKPRTLLDNGLIREYQETIVPQFLKDLSLFEPELFRQLAEVKPEVIERKSSVKNPLPLSFLIGLKFYGEILVEGKTALLINGMLAMEEANSLSLNKKGTIVFEPKEGLEAIVAHDLTHDFYERRYHNLV